MEKKALSLYFIWIETVVFFLEKLANLQIF